MTVHLRGEINVLPPIVSLQKSKVVIVLIPIISTPKKPLNIPQLSPDCDSESCITDVKNNREPGRAQMQEQIKSNDGKPAVNPKCQIKGSEKAASSVVGIMEANSSHFSWYLWILEVKILLNLLNYHTPWQ